MTQFQPMKFGAAVLALAVSGCLGSGGTGPQVQTVADTPYLAQLHEHHVAAPTKIAKAYESNIAELGSSYDGSLNPRVAKSVAANKEIVPDPTFDAYADRMVDRLLDGWPYERPQDIEVLLQMDHALRASARADHTIFLTTGILAKAESEDYAAAYMAHELAHILLGHFKANDIAQSQTNLSMVVATGAFLADVNAQTSASGVNLQQQGGLGTKVSLGASSLATLISDVVSPTWRREIEEQADILGYDLYRRAGYDTEVYAEFLADTATSGVQRSENMQNLAELSSYALAKLAGAGGMSIEDLAIQTALDVVTDQTFKGVDRLSCQYKSAEARQAEFAAYSETAYYSADKELFENYADAAFLEDQEKAAEGRRQGHQALLRVPAIQDAITRHEKVKAATEALRDERPREVMALLSTRELGSSPGPRARIALWDAHIEEGRLQEAIALLEQEMENEHATMAVYKELARAYRSQKRFDDALKVIETAEARLGSEMLFVEERIKIYRASGDAQALAEAQANCMAHGILTGLTCLVTAEGRDRELVASFSRDVSAGNMLASAAGAQAQGTGGAMLESLFDSGRETVTSFFEGEAQECE